LSTTWSRD